MYDYGSLKLAKITLERTGMTIYQELKVYGQPLFACFTYYYLFENNHP